MSSIIEKTLRDLQTHDAIYTDFQTPFQYLTWISRGE